jgi:GWxTD domain-containing protein
MKTLTRFTVGLAFLAAASFLATGSAGAWAPPAPPSGHFGGAEKSMALSRLSDEYRTIYWGLQYLLNPHQERQFLLLTSDEERDEWLRIFWARNDPTPTTEVNERRLEHQARVEAAREYFPSRKPPGWDRRGEILIRFGPPPVRNRTWGEVTATRYLPPGEQWYYPKLDMLVEFQETHQGGEYIYAMTEYPYELFALSLSENSPDVPEDELNVPRTGGEETRRKTSSRPGPELPSSIDYVPWRGDELQNFKKDLIATWEKEKVDKARENFRKIERETRAVFSYDLRREGLWFVFDAESFYGGEESTRVEFYCQIPTGEIGFEPYAGGWRSRCEFTVMVQDQRCRTLTRSSRSVEAIFSSEAAAGHSSFLPTQLSLPLAPGYYQLVFDVRDELTGKRGSYRTSYRVPSFADPRLTVSGIEFASRIGQAEDPGPFLKGALSVVPHPVRVYPLKTGVSLYFEVYGLGLDPEGISRYSVDYSITAHHARRRGPNFWDRFEEERKVVSSSFDVSGYGERDTQHLTIDTSNLWEDSFDLQIEIKDRVTGSTARAVRTFKIVEGKDS